MYKILIVSGTGEISQEKHLSSADGRRAFECKLAEAARSHDPARHMSLWRQTFNPDGYALVREVVAPPVPLTERVGDVPGEVIEGLTRREGQILQHLAVGMPNKVVARLLGLSVRTVETHRLNLRRKTRTGRREDLYRLAVQAGMIKEVGYQSDASAATSRANGAGPRDDRPDNHPHARV